VSVSVFEVLRLFGCRIDKKLGDENMDIKLFEPEDMKTGRGGGKKGSGEKYSKYRSAIAPHVAFLRDGIEGSKDGNVRVKVEDLAKAMGMTGKHETSIYWGLKYVLFGEGLVVTTGQTKANEPVLVIRKKKEGDKLPDSLTKHLDVESGTGKGPGAGSGRDEDTPPEDEQ
jgi:hypothetical protein